jgi:hypothetical protein
LGRNNVTKFLALGAPLGLILGSQEIWLRGLAVETCAALLLYTFACELYIFLFTLVDSSISAPLLLALSSASLTQAEIDRLWPGTEMVDRRIEKLVASGFLRATSSGWVVTAKGWALLAVFRILRQFFRLPGRLGSLRDSSSVR